MADDRSPQVSFSQFQFWKDDQQVALHLQGVAQWH